MHLVLPFASASSPAASPAASTLQLPQLETLLARLSPTVRDEGEDTQLSTPHERVLAALRGWPRADGLLPWAADQARRDGLAVDAQPDVGWALVSPTHWHVGTEQVSLADPASLALRDDEAQALFDAVATLFADDGWALHWGAPTRWYATHASLATLPTASLDRVIGRNVDLWLGNDSAARAVRRRQAEAQMLLHRHPLNEAREADGLLPMNSFWLSGTGPTQAPARDEATQVDHRLRGPALAEDWAAWAEAWAALDAGPIARWREAAEAGQPVQLTLCGERHAQTFAPAPRPWWRRGLLGPRRVNPAPWLAAL